MAVGCVGLFCKRMKLGSTDLMYAMILVCGVTMTFECAGCNLLPV